MAKYRAGLWRHQVAIEQFSGTLDLAGTPEYHDAANWTATVPGWPCEILTTAGNERVRGRQVTAETTHVFRGEFYGAGTPTAEMRVVHEGLVYAIISAYDPDGDAREMRIEAKRER